MRVGIMTEYPSVAVQSGPALHTRFLYEQMKGRGHSVVLMGPDTGSEDPIDASEVQLYKGRPYPTHPKVKIPMPASFGHMWNAPDVDVIHSQTNTHMVHYAVWMRRMNRVPVLNTHTVHLPTHSHFVISDKMWQKPAVRRFLMNSASKLERNFAKLYNQGDYLIVQSKHFVQYWKDRGVTIPIEVVGRPIDPAKFSKTPGRDPFPKGFTKGKRLLVVCRHDREKSLDHLIKIFAEHLAPSDPDITLTLVGDGHDHVNLVNLASRTGYANRIHFPGEMKHGELVDWYAHSDVFTYTSISETFGNVVNEALWCRQPVVALNDNMGVAHQVEDGVNGFLVEPKQADTDVLFAKRVMQLVNDDALRARMAETAAEMSRARSHPDVVVSRFEKIYGEAKRHCDATITRPLSEASTFRQKAALANHLQKWRWYNGWLLTIAKVATGLGAGRKVPTQALPAPTVHQTGEARRITIS
ncbi:MAG: glycosyltransferase [Bradymonadia bacterium]